MAFLPPIVWKKDGDEISQLRNYVMQLEEQIRYVLGNLGSENLTDGAIGAAQLEESVRTEIIETKNSAQKNSLAIKKSSKELLVKVKQVAEDLTEEITTVSTKADGLEVSEGTLTEDLSEVSGAADDLETEVEKIKDGTTAVKTLSNTTVSIASSGLDVLTGGTMTVNAGAGFTVETDADFVVHSQNLDVDETGLYVKSGTLQGEHYTTDGFRLLSESDIITSSSAPEAADGRVWVKILDSVTVPYSCAVSARAAYIGFSGTLRTSSAASGAGGTCRYTLRVPYHASSSSGSGADITVTVAGTLVFSGRMQKGYYGSGGYVGDFVLEMTVTSATWLGTNQSLSFSVSGAAAHPENFKINTGTITLTAVSAGSSGAGWKACEIKVYQG